MAQAFEKKRPLYTGTGQNPYMVSPHYLQKPDANLAIGPMTLPEWAKPAGLRAKKEVVTITLDVGYGERRFSLAPVRCAQRPLGVNNFDETRFDRSWK
jgi:hypothetical protein